MSGHSVPRETFYSVDATWLHMDAPANMVMIAGLALFDDVVDFARLRDVLEQQLLRFSRFQQRVREPLLPIGLPRWEPDPHFDLDAHLHRVALPEPADWPALVELIEDLLRTPLPHGKPLWQMHLIERCGRGSALLTRLSHAMADGAALMRVVNAITSTSPTGGPVEPGPTAKAKRHGLVEAVDRAFSAVEEGARFPGRLLRSGADLAADPARLVNLADLAVDGTLALGKLLFILPDPSTPLKGRCGVTKRVAVSDPLSLAQVKAIGQALGGKVNDVLLSAATGGFRKYLEQRGAVVDGVSIRGIIPVYLRAGQEAPTNGNAFGLTFLDLPIGVADPVRRLRVLKRRMDAIKRTPEAPVAYGIMRGMGLTPAPVERLISLVFGLKGTAVMTNVAGPAEVRYMAGTRIRRLMFWVPQPAGLAVGLSIMSYAGEITLGLATDARVVPDPGTILRGFAEEYQELERRAALAQPAARKATARHAKKHAAAAGKVALSAEAAQEPAAVRVAAPARQLRCKAETRQGARCRNLALPGSDRCRVHQKGTS